MINQVIYTIQCEGQNIGTPSVLIRSQGCNLKCPWCDTKQTWNKRLGFGWEETNNRINEIAQKYDNIKNIMLTGGEPMYTYFGGILTYIDNSQLLKNCNVEIETNGTLITPNMRILEKYKHRLSLNISPKLMPGCYVNQVSKDDIKDLYSSNMKTINEMGLDYNVKFIYDPLDKTCEDDIEEFIYNNDVDIDQVSIMTLTTDGRTVNIQQCQDTIEYCKRKGFKFTPRLHLMIYGDDTNEKSI